ncbi:hypothetical protein TIFTF001_025816 [Ficus carica]|uniref:Uncharacterized protein n=1 Tax=Ficus carica TaxID=3494 RepID=A0AA88AXC4_FICCA|nr:hypothetical protein TIFTF001_025816 [Ficus carica]
MPYPSNLPACRTWVRSGLECREIEGKMEEGRRGHLWREREGKIEGVGVEGGSGEREIGRGCGGREIGRGGGWSF